MRFIWILFAFALASLGFAQMVHTQALPTVTWSTFQGGTVSRIKTFETKVISTEGAWQTYWVRLTGNPASTAPKGIDWAREELWAIAAGERSSGGYNIYVRNAQFTDARNVQVEYVLTSPGSGGVTTQAITSPYVVLRVGRSGGVPKFIRCDDYGFNTGGSVVFLPPYYEDQDRPLRWSLLDRGQVSGIANEGVFALATRREFDEYVRKVFSGDEELADLARSVRWDNEMILAIHAGTKPRSTVVEIDRAVVDQSGRVLITWFENSPPQAPMTRCTPYLLMRLPRYTTLPTVRKVYGR